MNVAYKMMSLEELKVHLEDYQPYPERAIAATKTLQTVDPQSEEFSKTGDRCN
jgi:hypothetical protein